MPPAARQRTFPGMDNEPPAEEAVNTAVTPNPSTAPSAEPEGQTAYMLDTHALIFQVFHALPVMTSPSGEPVNAVYGVVRDVFFLLDEKRPDFLFAAFDRPGPTFRNEIYDQYKADRGEMPDELKPQIPKVRAVLEAMGIPVLDCEGFEADDVLATFARLCDERQITGRLVTADKDCRQLISEHVNIYNVRKDRLYGADQLQQDWGIRPDQVVDFQSLVGDKVDNVPGVPLIGPKIASGLLAEHDTLEAVLDAAADMKKGKRRDNLIAGRETALVSRQLVKLDRNVPVDIDWQAGQANTVDPGGALALFEEFGFRGFRDRAAGQQTGGGQAEWQADYQTVDTPEKLAAFAEKLNQQSAISFDTETTSVWPRWAEIVGLSFAWTEGQGYYIPVRGPAGDRVLPLDVVLEAIGPALTNPEIAKIGQNLKYDIIVLRNVGIELAGVAFDTMVASYLLDAGQRNHNLNELSQRYLGHSPIPISELIGTGKNQKRMDEVPVAQASEYAAEDADIPWRLRPLLAERLDEAQLNSLFRDVEMPLVEILAELESTGIRLDVTRLEKMSQAFADRLAILEQEIYELAGHEFNIASRKQLAAVLFEELELPVVKKTKTGPSTDSEVLEQLAREHALPAKIIEYRQFAKLKSTYVDALPTMVHPETKRIHCSFNQVVAATGRLSSSDPNLQNIPVRSQTGREIRAAFLPQVGWKLLAADYSQVELRMLAHFSGDEALCQAFANDQDIHTRVASEVYGVEPDDVTSDMRRAAKAVNFGIIYGQSSYGLAAGLGISQEEAAEFIEAYFARYATVENFLEKTLEIGRKNGYVTTILGRRRAIHGIREGAGRQRNLPERTAINTVVQGSAADLIKLAMIQISRRVRNEALPARMLLQIHDELIFEVPPNQLDYLGKLVVEEMTGVMDLAVPLKVDLKSGDNWADCEPWDV